MHVRSGLSPQRFNLDTLNADIYSNYCPLIKFHFTFVVASLGRKWHIYHKNLSGTLRAHLSFQTLTFWPWPFDTWSVDFWPDFSKLTKCSVFLNKKDTHRLINFVINIFSNSMYIYQYGPRTANSMIMRINIKVYPSIAMKSLIYNDKFSMSDKILCACTIFL